MRTLLLLVVGAMALLSTGLARRHADNKVRIAVYYESLCPDSRRFLTQQLAPAWQDLRGHVKVKLVPYGKSTHDKVNGTWQFLCHHGENECHGNKIQACILKDKQLVDTEKMDAVICLMNQTSPDKGLDACLPAEAARVGECASGARGAELLAYFGDKTDRVQRPLAFVPTVVIEEKYNQTIQNEAMVDLKAVVCRVAKPRPSQC